jgi:hypothetical protein
MVDGAVAKARTAALFSSGDLQLQSHVPHRTLYQPVDGDAAGSSVQSQFVGSHVSGTRLCGTSWSWGPLSSRDSAHAACGPVRD